LGNAMAQNNLGHCYEHGLGVGQNYKQAIIHYQAASIAGVALAKSNLGSLYKRGLGVKKKDQRKALELFQEASELGCAVANFELGLLHEEGEVVKVDLAAARRFYEKSAEKGHEQAIARLAELKAKGT